MTQRTTGRNLFYTVRQLFASVQLTIATLLVIAGTAIIGTVIPQNRPPTFYVMKYGEFFSSLINALRLHDMYHSLWFQALILILAINIVACSLERLKIVWKIIFPARISFSEGAFKTTAVTEAVTINSPVASLSDTYQVAVAGQFPITLARPSDSGFLIFAEKGRKTRLGVYVVHLSVLLLLIGALIGSFFGFEGFVNIPEGETITAVPLRQSSETLDLGFELRCDNFTVAFYPSGRPKDYRSGLSIIENGTVVGTKDIRVNDPLKHRGISFFQSSYGTASARNIAVTFTSRHSGQKYQEIMNIDETVTVPENMGTFTLLGFRSSYPFQMGEETHDIGETLIGMLENEDDRSMVPLPVRFPRFDRMRGGDMIISISDYDRTYYTGLQVRKDPGVYVVYAGFILMIIGIHMAFFMSHQRFCVRVRAINENTSALTVSWKTNKNESAAGRKAEKIRDQLAGLRL